METKIEKHEWFVLRLFNPNEPDEPLFVEDISPSYNDKRQWVITRCFDEAYQFEDRSDARRTARAKEVQNRLNNGYFWEVVKIVQTKTVTYESEFVVSNAPPLFQLARAAQ